MLPWSICRRVSKTISFLELMLLNKSGIILSTVQSPPPITLPALADTHEMFFFCKDKIDNNFQKIIQRLL